MYADKRWSSCCDCASVGVAWLISEPYCIAMLLACLEYWLEVRFCSIIKFQVSHMHQGRNGFAAEEHSLLNLQARLWQYAETPQLSCRSSVKLGLLAL